VPAVRGKVLLCRTGTAIFHRARQFIRTAMTC